MPGRFTQGSDRGYCLVRYATAQRDSWPVTTINMRVTRQVGAIMMGHPRATDTAPCRRADSGQPVALIDIGTALDLLAAVVRERGPGFVYRPVPVEAPRYPLCRYATDGAADCIVGQALARAGVSIETLETLSDDGIDDLYLLDRFPTGLTLGALAVLRTAQQSQDRGCRWGEVLAHATATALKILDLVPAGALEPPQPSTTY
jgi:hypothetical protein